MKGIFNKMLVAALLMSVVPGANAKVDAPASELFKCALQKIGANMGDSMRGGVKFVTTGLHSIGEKVAKATKPETWYQAAYKSACTSVNKAWQAGIGAYASADNAVRWYGAQLQAYPVPVLVGTVAAGYLTYKSYQGAQYLTYNARKKLAKFIAPANVKSGVDSETQTEAEKCSQKACEVYSSSKC